MPERDGDRRVAEALLDDPRVDALLEGERRPRVAEAVQGQPSAGRTGRPGGRTAR